ncbi:MAG TPA: lysylphosphatidylglycerol synthase domain-containing protein [Sphingobacteriaceae bacterium]
MNPSAKKYLGLLVKIVIILLAFGFIFYKLNDNRNLENFVQLIRSVPRDMVYGTLFLVFGLMLLNWFLESLKWKYLVYRVEQVSVWKAVESVFCGLTWAVFTPNRIGEYGGRVFFLSPRRRILGVIAMGVGAIAQMVITNIFGSVALLWFIWRYLQLGFWVNYALLVLVVFFCAFFILLYFNIQVIYKVISRIGFMRNFKKFFQVLARYKARELWKVFLYSLGRFVVFTSQYYILIHLLLPGLPLFEVCMMTFILFFIQSAMPSLDLLDVGVRSMTATYFFSFITTQEVAIMAVTACIWFVNLIIPAILGAGFVLKLNFFGTTNS